WKLLHRSRGMHESRAHRLARSRAQNAWLLRNRSRERRRMFEGNDRDAMRWTAQERPLRAMHLTAPGFDTIDSDLERFVSRTRGDHLFDVGVRCRIMDDHRVAWCFEERWTSDQHPIDVARGIDRQPVRGAKDSLQAWSESMRAKHAKVDADRDVVFGLRRCHLWNDVRCGVQTRLDGTRRVCVTPQQEQPHPEEPHASTVSDGGRTSNGYFA